MSRTEHLLYAQYGCGFTAPAEWVNFDASLTLRFERVPVLGSVYTKNSQRFPASVRYGNIVHGLPVGDESCRGVYASHVLEHLALADFHKALENTRRVLVKGGIFRLVVPDLEWAAREYLARAEAGDPKASHFFLQETCLGEERRGGGVSGAAHRLLNTSKHLWMWDAASMRNALSEHGFTAIRRCTFGDCEDQMFSLVEEAGRFEHAVAMEARRA